MSKKELERRQREEEATAHAFQEFIEIFQGTPGPPNKTFVRSAIFNSKTGQEIPSEKEQMYYPQSLKKQNSNATIKNAIECARLLKESKLKRPMKGQEKPKTNLELLKEELKQRHTIKGVRMKIRDDPPVYSSTKTFSNTDPNTTNLFIANINPKLTEQDLMELFGAYGPLASIKIMWPRNEDRFRNTNCGFVAYMSRKDSERAMLELQTREDMKIGWGKPVELPKHPVYVPPELLKSLWPPPCTGLPFNAQPLKQPFNYPTNEQEMSELLHDSVVKVIIPLDKKVLMTVHRLIEFVVREGPFFEAMIMNREITNPAYQFLYDNKNSVHIYYRWKLYSIMQGEDLRKWSMKEFRMYKNGSIWRPPVMQNYREGMPDHLINVKDKVDKMSMLSDAQRTRFIHLIQIMSMSKRKIGEAMVFCINHVEAVREVVDIILDSFMSKSTKPPKKIARLYLLSDVLYNSSLKKCYAPIYRMEFERHLEEIFKQLNITLQNLSNDIDKEIFKSKVLNVLRSWDLWKMYPNKNLQHLENIFLDIVPQNQVADEETTTDELLDGINLLKTPIETSNECTVNEQQEIATKSEESLKAAGKLEQIPPGFIPSKWETVDPEQVEAQAMSTKKFYNLEMKRQLQEEKMKTAEEELPSFSTFNKKMSESERDRLRKVEIMVMHYQDELESGKRKLKKSNNLEKELSNYRNYLLEKLEREHDDKDKENSSSAWMHVSSKDHNKCKETKSKSKKHKRY